DFQHCACRLRGILLIGFASRLLNKTPTGGQVRRFKLERLQHCFIIEFHVFFIKACMMIAARSSEACQDAARISIMRSASSPFSFTSLSKWSLTQKKTPGFTFNDGSTPTVIPPEYLSGLWPSICKR